MAIKYKFGNECLKRDLCKKWEFYEHFLHNQLLFSDKNTYLCLRPFASNKKVMIKICLYALIELTRKNRNKKFIFNEITEILSKNNYLNFEKYKSYVFLTAKYFSEQNIIQKFNNSDFKHSQSTIQNKINNKNEYFKTKIFKYRFRAEDLYYALAELKPVFVSCTYYSKKNNENIFINGSSIVNYKLTKQGKKLLEMCDNGYLI